ncbi:MAG: hypothetical protein ACYCPQ_00610 [Elusimicrobiota bacterium]
MAAKDDGAKSGGLPKARVCVGPDQVLSPAEAKRARYIQNLRFNHARLKEAMDFFERFAVICGLSSERIAAVRKANAEALDDLSRKFDAMLAGYERGTGGQ